MWKNYSWNEYVYFHFWLTHNYVHLFIWNIVYRVIGWRIKILKKLLILQAHCEMPLELYVSGNNIFLHCGVCCHYYLLITIYPRWRSHIFCFSLYICISAGSRSKLIQLVYLQLSRVSLASICNQPWSWLCRPKSDIH